MDFDGGVNLVPRTLAADGDLVIGPDDSCILISSAGGAAPAATTSSPRSGQIVALHMTAFNTNAYTMTVENGGATGTLTFNAADESALIQYDGTAWRVLSLNGATVV